MTANEPRHGSPLTRRHHASINSQTVGELSADAGESRGKGQAEGRHMSLV